MSRKGPSSIFKILCNIIDISQSQRVPSFRFFGTMRLLKIVIFCLKLGFLSMYLPMFFSKTIRNLDVLSWVKRYIWIFDVICELYSVLPRRRRSNKKRSHLGQHAISAVWDVTPRNKLDFQKTQGIPHFTISKSLSFLGLRYGADFRRSRLVTSSFVLILLGLADECVAVKFFLIFTDVNKTKTLLFLLVLLWNVSKKMYSYDQRLPPSCLMFSGKNIGQPKGSLYELFGTWLLTSFVGRKLFWERLFSVIWLSFSMFYVDGKGSFQVSRVHLMVFCGHCWLMWTLFGQI